MFLFDQIPVSSKLGMRKTMKKTTKKKNTLGVNLRMIMTSCLFKSLGYFSFSFFCCIYNISKMVDLSRILVMLSELCYNKTFFSFSFLCLHYCKTSRHLDSMNLLCHPINYAFMWKVLAFFNIEYFLRSIYINRWDNYSFVN